MARAQEGPMIYSGVSPDVTQAIGQDKSLRTNRMMEAMRQAGETERAGIAASAQVTSTGIGARSAEKVAAMRSAAEDERDAKMLEGQRIDRQSLEKREKARMTFDAEQSKLGRDYEDAIREKAWEKAEEIQRDITDGEMFNSMEARKTAQERNITIQKLTDSVQGQATANQKNIDTVDKMAEDAERTQAMMEIGKNQTSTRLATAMFGEQDNDVQQFFDEVSGYSQGGITSKMLTPGGATDLEQAISDGSIQLGDLLTTISIRDGMVDTISQQTGEAKETLTEKKVTGKKEYEESLKEITEKREDFPTLGYAFAPVAVMGVYRDYKLSKEARRLKSKIPSTVEEEQKQRRLSDGFDFLSGIDRTLNKLKSSTRVITVKEGETGQTVGQIVSDALAKAKGHTAGDYYRATKSIYKGDTQAAINVMKSMTMEPGVWGQEEIDQMKKYPGVQRRMIQQNEMMGMPELGMEDTGGI